MDKNKTIYVIAGIVLLGAIVFAVTRSSGGGQAQAGNGGSGTTSAVEQIEGGQVITISAKGGYSPRTIDAKAEIPIVLKLNTKGTFDCSAAFTIPSLGIRKMLPSNGVTEFELPPQKAGTELIGMCSMGMYSFRMRFN